LKEVACKAIGVFFRRAERDKVPLDRLLVGVDYSLEHLRNNHERIDWDAFVRFLDNASSIWKDEELERMGGAFVESPFFRPFAVIARLLFSPIDFYRYANSTGPGVGHQLFSCVKPLQREVERGRIILDLTLPPGYRQSRPYFIVSKGGLMAMPRILGLSPAEVEWHLIENGARFDIRYPEGGGGLAFLRRWVMWPFTVRAAARELKDANENLQARNEELNEARTVLALQATQLSVAHTISQLIHGDLDMSRTLEAIADALVQVGGFVAATVQVNARIDDHSIEMRAETGGPIDHEPICSALQSRGRPIGDVRVWHAAEHDPRERRELLEFVLPTLSMALDNAISYRALSDYQQALEVKVEQRTAELVQARDALAKTVGRLEQAQQVRDRIFANINHEIRTPLTLVHLAVSDLKLRYPQRLDQRSMEELDGIEMSTRKLLRLVDDLLLLAAGYEDKLQLRVTGVDLARLLAVIVATWRVPAERKGLQIAFQGPSRCIRPVDEEKIERVVTNLISNALKFTPAGGSVQVDLKEDVRGVEIAVRDTGIGIDDDLKKRLFGRFEQGRPSVHAGARGSGIGLSIVKELAEAHGGEVSVDSPRGGGSVFRVLLPADAQVRAELVVGGDSPSAPLRLLPEDFDASRAATPLPRVLEAQSGAARATILVAEDDPLLADAIGRLLSVDYRVVLAGDGLTGLRMAQQHLPDLLVSDVGMPGMDGLELTRRFRELPGNRLAPVVLLTAFANLADRLQGFDAGALDYVAKPFEPSELLARIRSQLELRTLALRLNQSEKLAALGTLSAGLAHEMRNPANAIVNAIEPLAELLPDELRAEEHPVGQLLGVLRECATQMALLSRQLLGFKRPGELEYQQTTVVEVIGRAQALTQPLFKSIKLVEKLGYKGPFACAASLLTQVLSNLLENGAHAAGAGGWVEIASRVDGERLVLEVSDSGGGVPVELRERIFEPFFTTKPPGSGTGLGLTTARQIVERHGGILDVREAGAGTRFHLELPLRADAGRNQLQRGSGR
jgi:signal transduction histidine kinase